jgi:tripartite-type tricarboxylate transporter receptor subunit TctC
MGLAELRGSVKGAQPGRLASSTDRRALLKLAVACGFSGAALGQTMVRPLSFVVPQPAGNPTDAIARKLQPLLQKELGLTLVVENLPGAGGSIGVSKMLDTPAGHPTCLIASQTETILTPLGMAAARYKAEALRPVALVSRGPYVLAGRPDLPSVTLAELTALARQPGSKPLSLGHVGSGSMIHLLAEQWSRQVKIGLTLVPYRGLPPIIQDLKGGQIDLSFVPLAASTVTMIESGKLRVYGTTTAAQVPRIAKVLPLSQQDPALRNFHYGTWAAVFVARSASEPEVQRLHGALAQSIKDPDFQAYMAAGGTDIADPMTLAQLHAFYQAESRLYQKLAQEVGVKPQ